MGKSNIIKILTIVFAGLIAILLIADVIMLVTRNGKIQTLSLNPDFMETELGVGSEYTFTVTASPEGASLKKVECVCDNPEVTFEMTEDGKAVLRTGFSEGTVTIYVSYKDDVKSDVKTYQIVDLAARAQAEAMAAEAAAAEEAALAEAEAAAMEEAAPAVTYVKMTGDNVNVRAQNNTDCEILGKAKKGDVFEKLDTVDDWTHIMFNGREGYIKSEFLTEASEDEANGGDTAAAETTTETNTTATTENKPEEKKEETKTAEQIAQEQQAAQAKAAEEAAKAQAEAEAAAQAAAAQAAAAQAAMGTPIHCTNGTVLVTAAQLQKIHATWDFAGDAIEMAGHHSIGDLEAVIGPTIHQ